jgi:2'-5' RNA ligase
MRMFVAVVPPEPVADDLEELLAPRREHAPWRWTPAEQWHVTLAFAAHVPDRAVDDLADRLAVAASRRRPFDLALTGGGAFPDPARARLLFSALEGTPPAMAELDALATGARNAVVAAGVEVDGQRFRPHVTLARLHRPAEVTRWLRVLDAHRGPSWTVREVALVASHLGEGPRGGPRHEVVATLSLGPAGSGPG